MGRSFRRRGVGENQVRTERLDRTSGRTIHMTFANMAQVRRTECAHTPSDTAPTWWNRIGSSPEHQLRK